MGVSKDDVNEWMEELAAVIKTYDVEKFRKFYKKWLVRGIYELRLPDNDRVIEIMMRKMVYHSKRSTDADKAEAKEWLESRGCDTNLG